MTLEEFNSKYEYISDGRLDSWRVMEMVDGKYKGDCEDYCITIQEKVDGFRNLELYYCKYDGLGHCVGKLGDMWIDCGTKRLVNDLGPKYTDIRKYWLVEIIVKKVIGRILRCLR